MEYVASLHFLIMIDEKYLIAIGKYLEERKNVNRYKNRLHRFRDNKLGLWSKITILLEMGYNVLLGLNSIEIIETEKQNLLTSPSYYTEGDKTD